MFPIEEVGQRIGHRPKQGRSEQFALHESAQGLQALGQIRRSQFPALGQQPEQRQQLWLVELVGEAFEPIRSG